MALRLLFHNVNRALCHTSSKHIVSSNSGIKESNENVPKDWKIELYNTMKVLPDFISEKEEDILIQEVDPYMKRLRYEYSHWDNVSEMRLINCIFIEIFNFNFLDVLYFNLSELFVGDTWL